jgi:hypothetical protein
VIFQIKVNDDKSAGQYVGVVFEGCWVFLTSIGGRLTCDRPSCLISWLAIDRCSNELIASTLGVANSFERLH